MDDVLHHERLRGGAKRLHRRNLDELPDGAFAAFDQTAFAIQGDTLLRWTPNGYHGRKPRPHRISVDVPTGDPRGPISWLHTAMASERKGIAFVGGATRAMRLASFSLRSTAGLPRASIRSI